MPVEAVITGDNHLNLYSQKLGSKLGERRDRIGEAWYRTIDYAVKNKVDLYINTGDLFDQLSPRNPPRARVVEAFKRLNDAGIEAFILAGNHEAPSSIRDGASPHTVLKEAGLATVFECYKNFEQEIASFKGVEVSVAGMSYDRGLGAGKDPLEGLEVPAGCDLNIALLHYSLERVAPPIWEEPMIKLASLEKNNQVDFYAMGHIHRHIETSVGDSKIVYPGATEHYNFGEAGNETGFVVARLEPGNIITEYIPVEAQPMRQVKLHASMLDPKDPTTTVLQELDKASHPEGLLQVVLEGDTPFEHYTKLGFMRLFDEGTRRNFHFEYIDLIRPIVKGLEFKSGGGLNPRRELEEVAKKAMEDASEEEQRVWRQAAEYALSYYERAREG